MYRISARALQREAENDASFHERAKDDPQSLLEKLGHPLATDPWIYRLVVIGLVAVIICVVLGGTIVSYTLMVGAEGERQREFPAALIAIGSAATGALAGLLAPSPRE